MVKVVVLDTGPLWLLTDVSHNPVAVACRRWAFDMLAAGHRLVVPEIADYEVRREFLLRGATRRLSELDLWIAPQSALCEHIPLTTPIMRRAAALWAFARQGGQPTAGSATIDADVILVAQAESLLDPNAIIASANLRHLTRFFPADLWSNIAP